MANTPFKMKGFSGFGNSPNKLIGNLMWKRDKDNDGVSDAFDKESGSVVTQEGGENAELIEVLKKQDEAELELEKIKEAKNNPISQEINV